MTAPNFVLLYVADVPASAAFYGRLLGLEPAEASPSFAKFALPSGLMLGLWSRTGVEPRPIGAPGQAELACAVEADAAVQRIHGEWVAEGVPVLQAPTRMDFGFTCVAADPDGHRFRVFAPGAAS
jgi:catechol 2,3-dioxygenase-like lactoylglutathione lyase family enzyme